MAHVDSILIPGETVAYRTRLHWIVLVPALLVGGILVLGAVLLVVFLGRDAAGGASKPVMALAAVLLLIGIVRVAAGVILRNATEVSVTTRRVLIKTGLLSRRTTEVLLAKVESVSVDESFAARLFGFGKVAIHGTGGTPESFDRIARPQGFRRQVQIQIEAMSTGGRGAPRPPLDASR